LILLIGAGLFVQDIAVGIEGQRLAAKNR